MSAEEILSFVRQVVGFLLNFVPHDEMKQILDDEAIKRANIAYELAVKAKFGIVPDTEPPSEPPEGTGTE
jgi:hypothetical protein